MIRSLCAVLAAAMVSACIPKDELDKLEKQRLEEVYAMENFTVTRMCARGQYDRTVMRDPRNGDLYVYYRYEYIKASPGLTPEQLCES